MQENLTSYFLLLDKNLLKGSNSSLSLMNLINFCGRRPDTFQIIIDGVWGAA